MADKKLNLNGVGDTLLKVANRIDNFEGKDEFGFKMIDIDLIIRSENNFYDIEDIESLAEDIKENGIYHNIVIRAREDGMYELISGERRHRAAKKAGLKKVPCKIVEVDDTDAYIMLIKANKETRKLSDVEWAKTYAELEKLMKIKKERGEIKGKVRDNTAKEMGISTSQAQRLKSIHYNLIPELKEMLDKKELTLVESFDLSKMTEDQQKGIYQLLLNNVNAPKEEVKKVKEIIKQREEELSIKIKELEKKDKENKELATTVENLKNNIEVKESKLNDINNNLESFKDDLKEELSKEAQEQNKSQIENLEAKIKELNKEKEKITEEKNKDIREKDNKIKELSETKIDESNIKFNAELSIILKNIESSFKEISSYKDNIKNASGENKEKLHKLHEYISTTLNSIG